MQEGSSPRRSTPFEATPVPDQIDVKVSGAAYNPAATASCAWNLGHNYYDSVGYSVQIDPFGGTTPAPGVWLVTVSSNGGVTFQTATFTVDDAWNFVQLTAWVGDDVIEGPIDTIVFTPTHFSLPPLP